jgi:hypothetical protein
VPFRALSARPESGELGEARGFTCEDCRLTERDTDGWSFRGEANSRFCGLCAQNHGDDATLCRPTAYVGQRPEEQAERQRDAVKAALSAHDAKTLSKEVTARIWMKQRVRKLYLTEAQREEQERADKAIFVHVHGADTSDSEEEEKIGSDGENYDSDDDGDGEDDENKGRAAAGSHGSVIGEPG